MAWNTGTSYISTSPVTSALINGIGNDLRTWGGNVDAGGYSLANLSSITSAVSLSTSVVVGRSTGTHKAEVYGSATATSTPALLAVIDATGYAQGVGGNIDLGGKYNSGGSEVPFARLAGQKSNGTSADAGGDFVLYTLDSGSGNFSEKLRVLQGGLTKVPLASLPSYANNAAAVSGGLAVGTWYRSGGNPDTICVVH